VAAEQVTIGTLGVIFGADTSALVRGARTVEAQLRNVERAASNVSNRLKAAFLAVAGPAALGYLIHRSIEAVSAQKDLAERLHVSVASVQVMTRAAELAGISQGEFASSAERLNRAIGTALRDSTGQQADAFKRLGLTAQQLSKMDLDKRFIAISNAVQKLNMSAPQTADFLKQIGIRGGSLGNLFIDGAEGIEKAREQLELFGLVNTNEQAAKIEAAGDAMSTFKLAADGVGNSLAKNLSPYIIQAAADFEDLARSTGGIDKWVTDAVNAVIRFAGRLGDIGVQIQMEIDEWSKGFVEFVNTIIRGVNKIGDIPGVKLLGGKPIEEIKTVSQVFNTSANSMIMDQGKLREKLGQPLPSDYLDAWIMKSKTAADRGAADWAAAQERRRVAHANGMNAIGSKEAEGLQKKYLALQASLAGEGAALKLHAEKTILEADELRKKGIISEQQHYDLRLQIAEQYQKKLRESLWTNITSNYATELEQLAYQHEQRMAKLNEYNAAELALVGGHEAAKAALEKKYAEDRIRLQAASWSAAASVVDTAMGQITDVMGDESKKGFGIMKALAYATALVKGYEAVVSAWATGEKTGIPGMGAIMAGIAAAGTAATIAKLAGVGENSKGTPTASSGGGRGGGGGGRGGASSAPANAPQQSMVVSGFRADEWLKGDTVRTIAKEIVKFQNDGGRVIIQ
jgi:hypothetical protein